MVSRHSEKCLKPAIRLHRNLSVRRIVWALCLPSVLAAQDARQIVERSLELDRHNAEVARNYTFIQRQQQRDVDSNGRVKKVESDTWDVTMLEGSPYRRKIAHNDKPLSARDQAREEANLRKSIEDRRKETPEQRAQRIQEWHRKQDRQREPLREIPEAFDLKLAAEEKVDGMDAWIIDATPHPGYRPRSRTAQFFPKVKARFWIAKQDYQWVKIDMVTLDTISFYGFLIRMAKGSHLVFEAAHVNNEVWLPKRAVLTGSVRLALFKLIRGDISFEYSDYRKFQTDSRVIPIAQ